MLRHAFYQCLLLNRHNPHWQSCHHPVGWRGWRIGRSRSRWGDFPLLSLPSGSACRAATSQGHQGPLCASNHQVLSDGPTASRCMGGKVQEWRRLECSQKRRRVRKRGRGKERGYLKGVRLEHLFLTHRCTAAGTRCGIVSFTYKIQIQLNQDILLTLCQVFSSSSHYFCFILKALIHNVDVIWLFFWVPACFLLWFPFLTQLCSLFWGLSHWWTSTQWAEAHPNQWIFGIPLKKHSLLAFSSSSPTLPPSRTHLRFHSGPIPLRLCRTEAWIHTDTCVKDVHTHTFQSLPAARAPGQPPVIAVVTGIQRGCVNITWLICFTMRKKKKWAQRRLNKNNRKGKKVMEQ